MKTRFMTTLLPVVSLGMITLSAGCADESKKSVTNDKGTPVSSTVVAAPVDKGVVSVESAPKAAVTPPALSPGVDEIVQLAQAGVGDEVLLAYIENTHTAYNLNVDQILYLHDLGVSAEVIAAMVRHSETLQEPSGALAGVGTNVVARPADETGSVTTAAVATTNLPPNYSETTETTNVAATVPQQVNYNYFYNTLSPYGTWLEVPDYGWCWQPSVAVINVNWAPYCDRGRWLYTDCGWYWQSDYSWGWAPFHYGRWHRSPVCGWVWVPDTVWGPAWVTWRYSDAYCGWAPLPPGCRYDVGFGFRFRGSGIGINFDFGLTPDCYTFIPTAYFCHRTPWYYRLPKPRVISIVHNTTIINNYVTGNNNTIVNVGPRASVIAGVTRNEIRKVTLRDIDPSQKTLVKADRLDRDGATLAVLRPKLPEQAPVPPPEIRNRQQESRKKAELIAKSDVVKSGGVNSDRRTSVASKPRAVTSLSGRTPEMPAIPPRTTAGPGDGRVSRSENPKAIPAQRPATIGDASAQSRRSEDRTPSDPALVKPVEQPRRLGPIAENQSRSIEPRATSRFEQPRSIPSQPNPVYRSEPVTRPPERPRLGQPIQPQSSGQPDSGSRVVTPPSTYRPEVRRQEPGTSGFSPALRYTPSPSGPGVAQPQPIAPRNNPPAYQPPRSVSPPPVRNEPVRIQPALPSRTQSAPSFTPSPAPSRPQPAPSYSAPSRSQPAPSSPSPSRSEGSRKER